MNKLPINLDTLPEPLKSMAQNLDPQMIENMLATYDPATMALMMNSVFAMLKDTLPPEQLDGLKEMMENLLKIMPQKG